MSQSDKIAERAVGQYPISIATSLALESICGIHPDIIYDKPPIHEYQTLWVNIKTLFRNFMGALSSEALNSVIPPNIATALLNEFTMLEDIINDVSNNKVKVIFYNSNYSHLDRTYPKGFLRIDNTDKQKEMSTIRERTIDILLKSNKETKQHDVRVFDLELKAEQASKALIMTNYAIDLLSHDAFSKLTLLESHTGKLKDKALWYTKFHQGKDLSHIPFNKTFIQIFGDSETFKPYNISFRKEILAIATKYNWSSVTTSAKINYGIDQMPNQESKDLLRTILAH